MIMMELGLEPAKTAGQKRQCVEAGRQPHNDELEQIMKVLAKLVLSNSLSIRTLKSVTLEVHRVSSDSGFVKVAAEAVQKYLDQTKQMVDEEEKVAKLGHPAIHIFNQWLLTAEQENPAAAEMMKNYKATFPEGMEVKDKIAA